MRSELVFIATGRVQNRFLLCHLVRLSSRKFHKSGMPMQETINKVFVLVNEQVYHDAGLDTKAAWESSFSSRGGYAGSRTLLHADYEDLTEQKAS